MFEALQSALKSAFEPLGDFSPETVPSFLKYIRLRFSDRNLPGGEPYFLYLADCLHRLSLLNVDVQTLQAAVLWRLSEVMEDPDPEVNKLFGPSVAMLSERVRRISSMGYRSKQDNQAEHFSHLVFALAKDLRVIVIILADRAHLLSVHEKYVQPDIRDIAEESQEIYAPIANRLGIGSLKFELEDLSFRILQPDIYDDLHRKVMARTSDREAYLELVESIIRRKLDEEGIKVSIKGRLKHLTSIYKKMLAQHIPFDEVYDVVGIRIVTETVKECYEILGLIHSLWKPIPKRFKDYIAMPKQNMYQSIHTSVIGPSAHPLEVQIRTREMDRISEIGIAAHWRYKDRHIDKKSDEKFAFLRQMIEMTREQHDPVEMMDLLKIDLFPDEVYVFTPKGDVKCLPKGSTVVDFAFQIHSSVGLRCKGGKVNNRLVPLRTELKNGDIIEILLASNPVINADWLNFVATSTARNRIRRFVRDQSRDQAERDGRDILSRQMKKHRIPVPQVFGMDEFTGVVEKLGYRTPGDLFTAIGFGELPVQSVINKITISITQNRNYLNLAKKINKPKTPKISVADANEILINFARCCEPLPGEDIVGFVTYGRGVTIHAKRCPSLKKLEPGRVMKAHWESSDRPSYPLRIVFEANYRSDLLFEINEILGRCKVVIISENIETVKKSKIKGEIRIEIIDKTCLDRILEEIRKLPGVFYAVRARAK